MSEFETLFNLYIEETREHMESMMENLLKLEKNPEEKEYMHALFRAVHTLKGSTASMGFPLTSEMLHKLEDLMSQLREGKVKLNDRMIQLILLCHDYLEVFLEAIMEGRGEEDLEMEHIFESLCDILSNAATSSGKDEIEIITAESPEDNGLFLTDTEYQNISKALRENKQCFFLYVEMEESCLLPEVKVWLLLREIHKIGEFIKSQPERPSEETFRAGMFQLHRRSMGILFVSMRTLSELQDLFSHNMDEIKKLYVGRVTLKEGLLHNEFLKQKDSEGAYFFNTESYLMHTLRSQDPPIEHSVATEQEKQEATLSKTYDPRFMAQILEKIKKAELAFLDVKYAPHDAAMIMGLYKVMHTIRGLAGFIGHTLIFDLANATAKFVEGNFKKNSNLSELVQILALKSINFMKYLGDVQEPDTRLLNEIGLHLKALEDNVIAYVSEIHQGIASQVPEAYMGKKLGEILIEKGKLDTQTIDTVIALQKSQYPDLKMGQVLVKEEILSLNDVSEALSIQEKVKYEPPNHDFKKADSFVRVPEQKIDILVDMMGELLILESLLKENVVKSKENTLKMSILNHVERMERILKDLQGITMTLRMVSLKQTFQKILRIGRDTARELRRTVDFTVIGENTEIDRSIVEKIQDPLLHLIRNAVSHGIEDSTTRKENNKKPSGSIEVRAYNKKGSVYIEIKDDGRGLDTKKILLKALEKGIAQKGKHYTEQEIIGFIFQPGFSTAESISTISGRGIGMNVVDTEIRSIGGKVEVRNDFGKGVTFILKIPVNLATINGTIIDIWGAKYILPTVTVKKIFKPLPHHWISIQGKIKSIKNREEVIKLVPLKSFMGYELAYPTEECMIVVLEYEGVLGALPVANVLGKQEIVIKALSREFQHLRYIAGATILGDGKVALILDLEGLFDISDCEEDSMNSAKNELLGDKRERVRV